MKILVVGSQAREHSIVMKLADCARVSKIYVCPGSDVMSATPRVECVEPRSNEELARFCMETGVSIVLVGPAIPMTQGLVDELQGSGIPVIGAPTRSASMESSKLFGKEFMRRHCVRTPAYAHVRTRRDAIAALDGCAFPVVVKSDTFVQSHIGVVIARNRLEAEQAIDAIFRQQADREAKPSVLIEEFERGREFSLTVWMDDLAATMLPPCRDYKRKNDGDTGGNTHGMGAYAPIPWLTNASVQRAWREIVEPTLAGMSSEGLRYLGPLYFGILLRDVTQEPILLEYNVRIGDPECQTTLALLETDLLSLLEVTTSNTLASLQLKWKSGYAATGYLVSPGYPKTLDRTADLNWDGRLTETHTKYFAAGLVRDETGVWRVSAGRVACATCTGNSLSECNERVLRAQQAIDPKGGLGARRDIGTFE